MSATSDIGSIKDALVDGSKKVCSWLRGRMRINNSLSLSSVIWPVIGLTVSSPMAHNLLVLDAQIAISRGQK